MNESGRICSFTYKSVSCSVLATISGLIEVVFKAFNGPLLLSLGILTLKTHRSLSPSSLYNNLLLFDIIMVSCSTVKSLTLALTVACSFTSALNLITGSIKTPTASIGVIAFSAN